MTEVYVDVGAASVEIGIAPGVAAGIAAGAHLTPAPPAHPEAVRALSYLRDSGVRIVLVTAAGLQPSIELRSAADDVVAEVPDRPNAPAFYLTNDIERCHGSSARLRTVFIGGAPPTGSIRRCDAVARDVQAAAMEILAADAMTPHAG